MKSKLSGLAASLLGSLLIWTSCSTLPNYNAESSQQIVRQNKAETSAPEYLKFGFYSSGIIASPLDNNMKSQGVTFYRTSREEGSKVLLEAEHSLGKSVAFDMFSRSADGMYLIFGIDTDNIPGYSKGDEIVRYEILNEEHFNPNSNGNLENKFQDMTLKRVDSSSDK